MVPGHERDHRDLVRFEATQISILDQVARVPMMPGVADVHADVIQEGGVFEPLALAIGQAVPAPRLIEQRAR